MIDRILRRLGPHFIAWMMISSRIFGTVGGLMVIYYVEFTMEMPHSTRVHFRMYCLGVVFVACVLTVLLALWETRHLRHVLRLLGRGIGLGPELQWAAGHEAVRFAARHHKNEAWLVPCSTLVPVLIALRVVDQASASTLINITLAAFMATSIALMSHFFVIEHCMKSVIRYLLDSGVAIDYQSMRPSSLRFRLRLCFTLIIVTTALMIGTMASQRAAEMIANPAGQERAIHALRFHSVFITIAALSLGVVYATIVGDSVARRVASLVDAMDRVRHGDLSRRLQPTGNDELDILARTFNGMVDQLETNNRTIRDLNANLEQKVAQRTDELEKLVCTLKATEQQLTANNEQLEHARAEAEHANRAKSQFLTNVSHELRTPLNGVIGMTDLLLDSSLDARQRKFAERVRSSGGTLLELLNDLLDFAKIEAGMMELDEVEFDFVETLETVMNTVAFRWDKDVELVCDIDPQIPPRLRGDPVRLRQILTNLTNNALKFTEYGEVVVRARAGNRDGDALCIELEVSDTGIGIAEENFGRIFEAFTQADASTTRKYGGTGLGLGICKQLCEMMGGHIAVHSVVGKGTTFCCNVQLRTTDCPVPVVDESLSGRRILILEPHRATAEMLRRQFAAWGIEVQTETVSTRALQALCAASSRGEPYHLALVSTLVRGVEDLTAAVGVGSELLLTRVIAMVSMAEKVDLERLHDAGYADCLAKPITRTELLQTLRRNLGVANGAREPSSLGWHADDASTESARGDYRILLVEDQEINQELAVEILAKAGYRCDVAGNGREAIEQVAKRPYDLILMDCLMPEMDGFGATRWIRAAEAEGRLPSREPLPIIALTASAMRGERERCLEAGMSDYLTKPIKAPELLAAVRHHLPRNSARTQEVSNDDYAGAVLPAAVLDEDLVDRPFLLRNCAGNHELAERLLQKLADRLAQDVAEMEQCLCEEQFEQLANLAHRLKGAAGSLGARRLAQAASEVERSGREALAQAASEHLKQLRDEKRSFCDHIAALALRN